MKVFRFVVQFKAGADFDPSALQKAVQGHLAEAGVDLIQFSCNGTDRCECTSEFREFPNGFPYRVKIFAGLDGVFEQQACPITCIPPSEMGFEEI